MADRQQSGELTLVAANTVFEGKIKTEGNIRIDGKFVGEVNAKANAAIGNSGVIEGNISARNVTVAGRITGTVHASEKLVLESKSVLHGDIKATRLVVDEGAVFDGKCDMKQASPTMAGKKE